MNYFNQLIYSFIPAKRFNKELLKIESEKNLENKYQYLVNPKTIYLANKYKNEDSIQAVLYTNLIFSITRWEKQMIDPIINLGANINRDPNTLVNALLKVASVYPQEREDVLETIIKLGFNINEEFNFCHDKNNLICKILSQIRPKDHRNSHIMSFDYFNDNPEELMSHPLFKLLNIVLKKNITIPMKVEDNNNNFLAEAMKTKSLIIVEKILSLNLEQNYFNRGLETIQTERQVSQKIKEQVENLYQVYQEKGFLEFILLEKTKSKMKQKL